MHFRVYALLVYALSGLCTFGLCTFGLCTVIAVDTLLSRLFTTVASTCPRCRLDLPPLSPRPVPAVISTYPRCHLDLPPLSSRPAPAVISTAGRDLKPASNIPRREQQDFSLRFEMTAGVTSRPTPAVIAPCPRCHLDRRERS